MFTSAVSCPCHAKVAASPSTYNKAPTSGRVAGLIQRFEKAVPCSAHKPAGVVQQRESRSSVLCSASAAATWPRTEAQSQKGVDMVAWAAQVVGSFDVKLARKWSSRVAHQVQRAAQLAAAVLAAQAIREQQEVARAMSSSMHSVARSVAGELNHLNHLDQLPAELSKSVSMAASMAQAATPTILSLGAKALGALVMTGAMLHTVMETVADSSATNNQAAAAAAAATAAAATAEPTKTNTNPTVKTAKSGSSTASASSSPCRAAATAAADAAAASDPVRGLIRAAAREGPGAMMAKAITASPGPSRRATPAVRSALRKFLPPSPAALVQELQVPEAPRSGTFVRDLARWFESVDKLVVAAAGPTSPLARGLDAMGATAGQLQVVGAVAVNVAGQAAGRAVDQMAESLPKDITLPSVTLPTVTLPTMSLPTDLTLPDLSLPKEMKEMSLPSVALPTFRFQMPARPMAPSVRERAAMFERARAEAPCSPLMHLLPLMAAGVSTGVDPSRMLAAGQAYEALVGQEGAGVRARRAAIFDLLAAARNTYSSSNLPAWHALHAPAHRQQLAAAKADVAGLLKDLQAFYSLRPLTKVLVDCTEGEVLSILATFDQQLQAAQAEAGSSATAPVVPKAAAVKGAGSRTPVVVYA